MMNLKTRDFIEPSSYRDPAGSVFLDGNEVYRFVTPKHKEEARELLTSQFMSESIAAGLIVQSTITEKKFTSIPSDHLVIQHEKLPLISYSYEWSFEMLKEAALVTLQVLKKALNHGYILKDGTSFNVTFNKNRMVFFDVLSLTKYAEGQTWFGFEQFCEEFLYPLLIMVHKNIDCHAQLRGGLGKITIEQARSHFSWADAYKPGVLKHVLLASALSKSKRVSSSTMKGKITMGKLTLMSLVDSLTYLVKGLKRKTDSIWSGYATDNTYNDENTELKKQFIEYYSNIIPKYSTVVDLGCNTGVFSKVLSNRHAVIATDLDSTCIDQIWKLAKENGHATIYPSVQNLMNPSPSLGWQNSERKDFLKRINAKGFVALALIHHLCITHNLPIHMLVDSLAQNFSSGVIEWVDKTDPMVQFLLRNRDDIFDSYTWDDFEAELNKRFKIIKTQTLNDGHRTLCHVERRS